MNIEIERKFLVLNDSYKASATPHRIAQGYICNASDRVVRIRCYDQRAFITLKDATVGFARHEFEYEIPVDDARQMLDTMCMRPIIDKTRYCLPQGDLCWEIDEFHGENEGLVVAEIELPSKETKFEKPAFIGREVTGDERYYNSNLIKNPFKNWEK